MGFHRSKMNSGWKINVLLLLGVLLVCLVLGETLLRLAGVSPRALEPSIFTFDDTLGWVGIPGSRAILQDSPDGRISYEMNCWGFRDDPKPDPDQAATKKRLMFLGDSYVMGYGVPKEARVSELIETADTNFIAYNFGITGYSTDQELLVLTNFGREVRPHAVLLFFCANDLIYNDSDYGHRKPKPHFRLEAESTLRLTNVPVPYKSGAFSSTLHKLALGQLLSRVMARLSFEHERTDRRPSPAELGLRGAELRDADLDSLFIFSPTSSIGDITFYLLLEMKAECRRRGARFIVFVVPSNYHWTASRNDTPAEIQRVLKWCSDLDIEAVNLFSLFYTDYQKRRQTLYISDNMHWNAAGNRVAALAVLEALRAAGL